ncbi:hypothetical protein A5757_09335 [Mycobacterium sp. 852013-51886_SCH5428379]|uniref:hypothetical protein n=1 Tax=Mycobacterium sp. 852013-51886_SCH5428379 TaxID=1834111 RepID=UPI0007FCE35C|nr:hypothetical protein [Mycobacterium sp. 852013-51886_SCH5428379]OBB60295.1 hypothetical protein A5757_09335 [Mycobacterium sp. 852013-51886_SCH5428379]
MTPPVAQQDTPQHDTVEWFLARGVPAVLRPRDRWSGVLSRSAPGLAAYLTLMVASLAIAILSGGDDIHIEQDPTLRDWTILALLVLCTPVMGAAAWAVSRLRDRRARRAVAIAAIVLGPLSDLYQDGPLDALTDTVTDIAVLSAILLATASGLGAVLAWTVRTTVSHLASAGRLAARALPVVLLTVLAFFNGPVWAMAAKLTTDRFWLLAAFMAAIAISFLTVSLRERTRALTAGVDQDSGVAPLSLAERANLLFVAVGSQVIQTLTVALVTMAIFLALGFIVLTPPVLEHWTDGVTTHASLFDIVLPVPLALTHVTLFLGGLTFMYLSARAVSDPEHRADFLDPLFEDLRVTLQTRGAYRTGRAD